MIYDELVTCSKCNNKFVMYYGEGSLGSLGYYGECSCGDNKHFIGLGSLELRFDTKEQNNLSINLMLQIYLNEDNNGKVNYPRKKTIIRNY